MRGQDNLSAKPAKGHKRVAAIQVGSVLFDKQATLDKYETWLVKAAEKNADLAVFPEAFIGGYPKGHHFGAPIGSRSEAGRDWFARYFNDAIVVPGPECDHMAKLSKTYNIDVIVGVIEREGGTLYCSVLCFSRTGALVGKRRKLMPTAAERLIWGQGDGSSLTCFETETGRLSGIICWENFMPALRLTQYDQGVEIYCAPTVDDRESWGSLMRTIAMEGRCFVVSSHQYFQRKDCPKDFKPMQGDAPDTVLINGGSMIVSPLGEVVVGPVFGEEGLIMADIDLAEIARGKYDFDVTGHYGRSDIFTLNVNRNKHTLISK